MSVIRIGFYMQISYLIHINQLQSLMYWIFASLMCYVSVIG
ncbi:hypothetical protein NM2002038_0198 [Neisseria meningitidis 2002038]|nr:hypothetical protein NM97021_0194 [Neisseria meningitidis 97021]ELK75260.1 hypothetical protein NM2006087_0198 [Neisseria meningitidis 2006087]ELK79408.1 hypothetical protein NM2002038_0198 [Neisseria meningitidis 2002038]ELK80506.1 hypothetical protein NM97014_0195 [Neisseria meningitidis 97014]EOC51461.1 hypothetical protein NM2005172_1243 [Neisseria meningitidis 2005172]EOC54869.1 hypothetical protein NM2008223_0280 [Neisseria meningitidis 2008223]EPF58183.1 hypothetical protein NM98002